eukprot:CAMPEP_0168724690 /NCGR_PEP_ID=MMETSP0724-20121128/3765_1 /TAXON_ID=265536 /ORGANISM="Amphiprora sp., Strain CCMP467" /LENGTH=1236 /DNA_ID=CAMNT_0008771445 /DNA_START=419 /DNA_END=4129 /DNA_ORIENTATION=+
MTSTTAVSTEAEPHHANKKTMVSLSPSMLPVMKKAFSNLCKNSSGVLYESPLLRVGVKHDYSSSSLTGKMVLFFQTPASLPRPLHHVKVQMMEPSIPKRLILASLSSSPSALFIQKGSSGNSDGITMVPHHQAKLTLEMEYDQSATYEQDNNDSSVKAFETTPSIRISFETKSKETGQEEIHQYPLLLPIVATSFFSESKRSRPPRRTGDGRPAPALGFFLKKGSSKRGLGGGLGSASVAGETPATKGGDVNIHADGGKTSELLQKRRSARNNQSNIIDRTATAHSVHARSSVPMPETSASDGTIVLSSSTKDKKNFFEQQMITKSKSQWSLGSEDSKRRMSTSRTRSKRDFFEKAMSVRSLSSQGTSNKSISSKGTPPTSPEPIVSKPSVRDRRNVLNQQKHQKVAMSTSALPVSPRSRTRKTVPLSPVSQKAQMFEQMHKGNLSSSPQPEKEPIEEFPALPLSPLSSTDDDDDFVPKSRKKKQVPAGQRRGLLSEKLEGDKKGKSKSNRRLKISSSASADGFSKSKLKNSSDSSVGAARPPTRTNSASSTDSDESHGPARVRRAGRRALLKPDGSYSVDLKKSDTDEDEGKRREARRGGKRGGDEGAPPDRRSALRKSLSSSDLDVSMGPVRKGCRRSKLDLMAAASSDLMDDEPDQKTVKDKPIAKPTPKSIPPVAAGRLGAGRSAMLQRSASTRFFGKTNRRASLDLSSPVKENKPKIRLRDESTGPKIGNKVPKIVKGLQSGCFLSQNHVPQVLQDCVTAIHDDRDAQLQLGESNAAIPSLIQIMHQYQNNGEIQEMCCKILRDMCESHKDIRLKCSEQGAIEKVLVALLTHTGLSLQITGVHALANLALHRENRQLIHESKGLEVLKTCMDAQPDSAELQMHCCRAIAALADLLLNARAIAALKMSKAVVQAMRNHSDYEELQMYGCLAIRTLCAETDANRGSLAASGAIERILRAMGRFEKSKSKTTIPLSSSPNDDSWGLGKLSTSVSAGLQSAGCFALWNITINHSMNSDAIVRYYEGNNDGVRYIITAMKDHIEDAAVQKAGCGIIKNLTDREDNARIVADLGGVVCVLNAMRQHEKNKAIQTEGCGAVCNLAMLEDQKTPILNAGGVGVLVVAMQQLRDVATIQKQACKAFKSLALGDEQNQISIAAAGGISAILAAMDRHDKNAAMQVLALGALDQLAIITRNRNTIISNDGVRIIQQAMANHPKDKYIERTGWKIVELLVEAV